MRCCQNSVNTLNAELNPICHLLALLGANHIFHVSGIRVKRIALPPGYCTVRSVLCNNAVTCKAFIISAVDEWWNACSRATQSWFLLFIFIYCLCSSENQNVDIPREGSVCGLVH
jgi:hypothetical protein